MAYFWVIKKVSKGWVATASGRNFLFKTKRAAEAFTADNQGELPL